MSIRLQLPKLADLTPRLTVVGVGGAGCNAINNMIAAGLHGVEFVVANTDAQALAASSAEHRIQLGINLTEGLGAGSKPEIGEAAAEEAIEDIRAQVQGSHMVFIAAGMGGGTGTGAASVIARVARELGILTVGVVTKPFQFEGARRLRIAEAGIAELRKVVDTLIVIPNQNLFRIANEKTTFAEAFVLADQVLYSGVACIVDLIVKEGLINLDFADVRTVMSGMGTAMMGTGEATGDRRAILAAEEAISNPLLDEVSLKGARGLLLSITGGRDLTLYEVDEAASRVRQEVDPEANIIVGATFDEALGDRVRVSIVASGMVRMGEKSNPVPPAAEPVPQTSWPRSASEVSSASVSASQPVQVTVARQPEVERKAEPPRASFDHEPPMARAPVAAASDMYSAPKADAAELQRRLSEAMPYGVEANYAAPPAPVPHGAAAAQAQATHSERETWRAPGNVMIEEGLPHLTASPQSARPPAVEREAPPDSYARDAYYGESTAAPDYGSFTPSAPNEVRRAPASRRMPEVEDFPVVGQRDYHAKSVGVTEQSAAPSSPHQSAGAIGSAEHRRKPGFFERLTGRGRHEEPANHAPESHESLRPAGRPANASQAPAGGRSNPTSGVDRNAARGQASRTEGAELPVFFNRERK